MRFVFERTFDLPSPPSCATVTGSPPAIRSQFPRAGWAVGSASGCCFAPERGICLCLFTLVVPPGEETLVHDHLAWGLVGLYRGQQKETVYSRRDDGAPVVEKEERTPAFARTIDRGDFYLLLPPAEDIHRVRTTSAEPSVSLHLLTNDTGCVWRHTYNPQTAQVSPFRSGYANRACDEEAANR